MLSVVHYVWELRHTFCCCHCLVDAASPEGRHAPILEVLRLRGNPWIPGCGSRRALCITSA